jgi:hypothetical protein
MNPFKKGDTAYLAREGKTATRTVTWVKGDYIRVGTPVDWHYIHWIKINT